MGILTFDLVESLGYKSLNGFEALHHKSQGGKLTAAIWDQLIGQRLGEDLLQAKRLEPGKGRTWRRSEDRRTSGMSSDNLWVPVVLISSCLTERSPPHLSADPAPAGHRRRRWCCSRAPSASHTLFESSWEWSPKTSLERFANWVSLEKRNICIYIYIFRY